MQQGVLFTPRKKKRTHCKWAKKGDDGVDVGSCSYSICLSVSCHTRRRNEWITWQKQVQHNLDNFLWTGLTEPNIAVVDDLWYQADYQIDQGKLKFTGPSLAQQVWYFPSSYCTCCFPLRHSIFIPLMKLHQSKANRCAIRKNVHLLQITEGTVTAAMFIVLQ